MTNQWNSPADWTDDVLITASTVNAQVRDNLEFLRSRPFNSTTLTTKTTTSATFVEMTSSSIALTSYGGNMLIVAVGKVYNTAISRTTLDLAIDGTRQGDATNGLAVIDNPAASYMNLCIMTFFTTSAPSATSHNYSIYWKTSGGTASGLFSLFVMEAR